MRRNERGDYGQEVYSHFQNDAFSSVHILLRKPHEKRLCFGETQAFLK